MQNAERDRLVLTHLPLVSVIARGIEYRVWAAGGHNMNGVLAVDDLIQAGTIGLIEAAERYDAARGSSFELFAKQRIRGAMLDAIRHAMWGGRSVSRARKRFNAAREFLPEDREPTDEELAAALHCSPDTARDLRRDAQSLKRCPIASITNEVALVQTMDEGVERHQMERIVARAMAKLTDRQRDTLRMEFWTGVQGKEIAARMGVSPSRVSQIKATALQYIRRFIRCVVWCRRCDASK